MKPSQHNALKTLLQRPETSLSKLIDKVNRLRELNQSLYETLDPPLAKHCQISTLENNRLTLYADTSAWATRIRYLTPDLIPQLRKHPLFSELEEIHCRIQPKYESHKRKPRQKLSLSGKEIDLIRTTAQNITDPELQKALLKLSRNKKK